MDESTTAILTEDVEDLELAISEALADLSQAVQGPREVFSMSPFEFDEVSWSTNGWMSALIDVQGWLRLPIALDPSAPETLLESLREGLDPGSRRSDRQEEDGQTWLGLLTRLRERCARALELQKQYLEDLEDDATSASAEQRWRDAWEDAQEDPDLAAAEPVSASTDIWPISDFADRAKRGRLNLSPSYQRGDVWPTPDAQILMESILRGIPLPSVIILKPQNSATGVFEVVDGKQRLTAILRFIGRHPRALEVVKEADAKFPHHNLASLFADDYRRFRVAWKNATGDQLTDKVERGNYFPFKLRSGPDTALHGALQDFQGRYYTEIRDHELAISDNVVAVSEVFESASSYKIPVIQYTKATPRQVHEVFKLYNKQGKQLNAEEIRNAMYHELALMRGLLVAAGDSTQPRAVAPFLHVGTDSVWLEDLGRSLEGYGFGVTRYKRTKVLSWFTSLLLLDSRQPGGRPARRSTAAQIDALLKEVESVPSHSMRTEAAVADLFSFTASVIEAHQAVPEAWDAKVRDGSAGKWREMPLVGTLLGVAQAVALVGEAATIDALDDKAEDIARAARRDDFGRPRSIQTNSQWGYISRLAVGVAETLGVSPTAAHEEVRQRFGSSGVAALLELSEIDEAR